MSAEILVMCTACAHPQSARQAKCLQCGAQLPSLDFLPPGGRPGEPEDAVFWHAELRGDGALALSRRRIGYRRAGEAKGVELSQVASASLERRIRYPLVGAVVVALALTVFSPW